MLGKSNSWSSSHRHGHECWDQLFTFRQTCAPGFFACAFSLRRGIELSCDVSIVHDLWLGEGIGTAFMASLVERPSPEVFSSCISLAVAVALSLSQVVGQQCSAPKSFLLFQHSLQLESSGIS